MMERFSTISRSPLQDFDATLLRYDMMVLLLWLMMCETRQDLTRGGLNDWLNGMPVSDAMELVGNAVSEAVKYSFPEPAETPDKESDETKPDGNPTDVDI